MNVSYDKDKNSISREDMPSRRQFLGYVAGVSTFAAFAANEFREKNAVLDERQESELSKLAIEGTFFGVPFAETVLYHALPGAVARKTKELISPRSFNERVEYINNTHKLSSGAAFQNFGVAHTEDFYHKYKKNLLTAIKNADIISLEAPLKDKDCKKDGFYFFKELRLEAALRDKVIYQNDCTSTFQSCEFTLKFAFLALQAGQAVFGLIRGSQEKAFHAPYRGPYKLAAWFSALTSPYSLPKLLAEKTGVGLTEHGYNQLDFSVYVDWRTIKMLQNVHSLGECNPGKKILHISGNNHANGMEFYLRNKKAFNFRSKLYSYTYDLLAPPTLQEIK